MKKRIIVVGSREEIGGYKLAGISNVYDVNTPGLADRLIGEDAIIFITEEAEEKLGGSLDRIRGKSIVQKIPSKDGGYIRLRDIMKDTIGFELKK
jgi:V/A-type H+-transporting ATPase subunit F